MKYLNGTRSLKKVEIFKIDWSRFYSLLRIRPVSLHTIKGMSIAITGPTLLELKNLVNTDMAHIAFIYTARSAGCAFGNIAAIALILATFQLDHHFSSTTLVPNNVGLVGTTVTGVIFDALTRTQMVLTIFNFSTALTMLSIPWSRSMEVLTVLMTINGVSLGILETGSNVCCLSLWGKDSGPYFQALHCIFGLGALIAPLIAAPFLGDYESDFLEYDFNNSSNVFANTTTQNSTHYFTNEGFEIISGIPRVTYAFTIIGVFALLVTTLFFIVCIITPKDSQGQRADETSNGKRM
ncbi:sodium-dependent glucose transporter 1 [Caerostris darwini]|uniref:Sodium-dependent glucose transporter 1 n=1 Tax=Caerostris darwini TaxID=1538125 RepID=A0AAV4WTM5_9ARAC|nr:sodium-dependent glucose transporter 1 [Caerostris darwini]